MLERRQRVAPSALTLALLSALLLIVARPAQAQIEAVLYNFCYTGYCSDGQHPESRLTVDGAGNLYGTTHDGGCPGDGNCGRGVVFEISPNGQDNGGETVLYTFCSEGGDNCTDGANPNYSYVMFDSAGNLYGTTISGGAYGYGVVFELSPVGGAWTEAVLYSFTGGADGGFPVNGLIMDKAGNLYGTVKVSNNGQGGGGVFELNPSGGGWTEQLIYGAEQGNYSGLTTDAAGNIFGTTVSSVFELSPNGQGGWNPKVLYTFTLNGKDGYQPENAPVSDGAGNLYGTTVNGGAKNAGTVYELISGKKGKWTEKVLYSFKGKGDSANPWGGVVLDAAGNIFGTTTYVDNSCGCDGTVFELVAPVGKGTYKEKVLWDFNRNGEGGVNPTGSLIMDSAGNLYGTTEYGGVEAYGGPNSGVVFELTP
jgi:uncharacterized repeat protein (TIGR03803 family)